MRTYKQLTSGQRYQIFALTKIGYGPTEIAEELEVHKSTISRELARNRGERGYRPKQADEKARERREEIRPQKRIRAETWKIVEEKICQDWSPEQVSGWMKKNEGIQISHEWIYQYILADKQENGKLYTHLRQHGKRDFRSTRLTRAPRCPLPTKVSISQSPRRSRCFTTSGRSSILTRLGKLPRRSYIP